MFLLWFIPPVVVYSALLALPAFAVVKETVHEMGNICEADSCFCW
jgi:hypothetical protein